MSSMRPAHRGQAKASIPQLRRSKELQSARRWRARSSGSSGSGVRCGHHEAGAAEGTEAGATEGTAVVSFHQDPCSPPPSDIHIQQCSLTDAYGYFTTGTFDQTTCGVL